jgi:hypothetical protein
MLPAQVEAPAAAVVAHAAGVRRVDRHLVAGLDAGDGAADALDHARHLVPRDQRLAHDEGADAAMLEVVQVRPADAAGAQAHLDLVRGQLDGQGGARRAGRARRGCGRHQDTSAVMGCASGAAATAAGRGGPAVASWR